MQTCIATISRKIEGPSSSLVSITKKFSKRNGFYLYPTLQAYSVFLIETAQTALTGADIYYWFMAGFGNLDRLRNSRFSAIDSPTIDAFISLIVQGFFCYRIWTLNKRMWWLCLIIAVVCPILFLSALFDASLPKLSVAQAIGAAWGGIKVCHTKLPMILSNA